MSNALKRTDRQHRIGDVPGPASPTHQRLFVGRSSNARARVDPFSTVVVTLGIVYVAMCWTPSSYGVVLRMFQSPNAGLVLGQPRVIRADEYWVWTPSIQASVRNSFQRLNETSVYREDLRNFNALPLWDWALPFKPQFWLFFLAPPSYAFSYSHAIFFVLFLIGYDLLFRELGFSRRWSVASALLLFFTSHTQLWWTTLGPLLALFPWVLLSIGAALAPWLKSLAVCYATTVWLLSHLYPPVVISLGFVGAVLVFAFWRDRLTSVHLLATLVGLVTSLALVLFYYRDVIPVMEATVYPGTRRHGGGAIPVALWASQFFPRFLYRSLAELKSLIELNVCEASTVGSYLPILFAAFVDYRRIAPLAGHGHAARTVAVARWRLAVIGIGLLLMSAWFFLPLPPEVGRVLLWDRVPPSRMMFAYGLLLLCFVLAFASNAEFRLTWPRFWVAAMVVAAGAWVSKSEMSTAGFAAAVEDAFVLIPVALVVACRRILAGRAGVALIGCAALANAFAFGLFNPIQSAKPIMTPPPETPIVAELRRKADRHPDGWLVVPGFPGAILNGIGFKSVSHVLMTPQMDFFRPFFPEMPQSEFEYLFNRYAHLQLHGIDKPSLPRPDVIWAPVGKFDPRSRMTTHAPDVRTESAVDVDMPRAGYIDDVELGSEIFVSGWGKIDPRAPGVRIKVIANMDVEPVGVDVIGRPDVVAAYGDWGLILSGFRLRLRPARPSYDSEKFAVAIVTEDPRMGTHLLHGPRTPPRSPRRRGPVR